jgi:hypothetical protein
LASGMYNAGEEGDAVSEWSPGDFGWTEQRGGEGMCGAGPPQKALGN